jgi:hypothetical protein
VFSLPILFQFTDFAPRYRLFGRFVRADRSTSEMNKEWRRVLRTQELASLVIHRAPPPVLVQVLYGNAPVPIPQRPYIHILYKTEFAERWMTGKDSPIPGGWLRARGFGSMDHFSVKVGRQ